MPQPPNSAGIIRFSLPPDLPGVGTVIHLDGNRTPSSYLNAHYTLKLIRQSASTLHFRGKSRAAPQATTGLVCLLDPGEMLRTSQVLVPEIIQGIMITPEFMTEFADELGVGVNSLWFRDTFMSHSPLAQGLEGLFAALAEPQTVLERQTRLAQVLKIALDTCMEAQPRQARIGRIPHAIRRAKALLQQEFAAEVSLEQLIAETGLSRCLLIRAFTREVGVPPHRYQIHLRIARARELLARGLPPSWVATSVGFYDQSHFGKQFRRIVGVTPKAYAAG